MFENEWVFLDVYQAKLHGFEPNYGLGVLVRECISKSVSVGSFEVVSLNPIDVGHGRSYSYAMHDARVGGVLASVTWSREKALDVVGDETLIDKLDPYRSRIEIPCNGGVLFAEFFGDAGIYDGIVTCFKRDSDGGEIQCAMVETISEDIKCGESRDGLLHGMLWDNVDGDDYTVETEINKDSEWAVFANA